MKRRIVAFILTILTAGSVYAEGWELKFNTLDMGSFREFIITPNMDNLTRLSKSENLFSQQSSDKYIYFTSIKEGEKYNSATDNSFIYIGDLLIKESFAEYINDASNIQMILSMNGVDETVKEYALLDIVASSEISMHPTLWIATNENNYFVQIVPYDHNTSDYQYLLSTQQEFINNLLPQNFKLRINNTEVQYDYVKRYTGGAFPVTYSGVSREYTKFSNGMVFLPFRAIIEALGNEVIWNNENRSITINTATDTYIFALDEHPAVYKIEDGVKIGPIGYNEWVNFTYEILDGTTVMSDYTLSGFLQLINAEMDIDYDNRVVSIID